MHLRDVLALSACFANVAWGAVTAGALYSITQTYLQNPKQDAPAAVETAVRAAVAALPSGAPALPLAVLVDGAEDMAAGVAQWVAQLEASGAHDWALGDFGRVLPPVSSLSYTDELQ